MEYTGIARVGNQRHVAGVDEAQRHVGDPFLRPDERQHLFVGVERQAEALLVPRGDRLPQLRHPFRLGIAVIGGVVRRVDQRIDDVGWRWYVGVADGEGDDVYALRPLRRYLPRDLSE